MIYLFVREEKIIKENKKKKDDETNRRHRIGKNLDNVRNDTKLGSLRGIREARFIQCSSDEDIQVGDMLVSAVSGEYFHVTKISYEIVGNTKTSMQAYFLH